MSKSSKTVFSGKNSMIIVIQTQVYSAFNVKRHDNCNVNDHLFLDSAATGSS